MKNTNITKKDSKFIKELFLEYLNDYKRWWKALWWEWNKEQQLRFKILLSCIEWNNNSILDVWCGIWDLYKYIFFYKYNNIKQYVGVDILENSINTAKELHPNWDFNIIEDIKEIKKDTFDYIIASGIFAVNIENAKEKYFSMIEELFFKSKKWFVFNMLDKNYTLKDDPEIIQFEPNEVLNFCQKISKNVTIIQWYLPIDFTIYMKHEYKKD